MNDYDIVNAPTPIIKERLQLIEEEMANLDSWFRLSMSPEGVAIKAELSRKLEAVRSLYRRIPVTAPYADKLLAGVQGQEEELGAMVTKLASVETRKKDLDSELVMLLDVIKSRSSSSPSREDSRMVSKHTRKDS